MLWPPACLASTATRESFVLESHLHLCLVCPEKNAHSPSSPLSHGPDPWVLSGLPGSAAPLQLVQAPGQPPSLGFPMGYQIAAPQLLYLPGSGGSSSSGIAPMAQVVLLPNGQAVALPGGGAMLVPLGPLADIQQQQQQVPPPVAPITVTAAAARSEQSTGSGSARGATSNPQQQRQQQQEDEGQENKRAAAAALGPRAAGVTKVSAVATAEEAAAKVRRLRAAAVDAALNELQQRQQQAEEEEEEDDASDVGPGGEIKLRWDGRGLRWVRPLHDRFMAAVAKLGGPDKASRAWPWGRPAVASRGQPGRQWPTQEGTPWLRPPNPPWSRSSLLIRLRPLSAGHSHSHPPRNEGARGDLQPRAGGPAFPPPFFPGWCTPGGVVFPAGALQGGGGVCPRHDDANQVDRGVFAFPSFVAPGPPEPVPSGGVPWGDIRGGSEDTPHDGEREREGGALPCLSCPSPASLCLLPCLSCPVALSPAQPCFLLPSCPAIGQ